MYYNKCKQCRHCCSSLQENPFLTKEHWVQIYPNKKEINYISPSSIRASVETRPSKLQNLLQFFLPSYTWHFIGRSPEPREVLRYTYF